MRDEHGIQAEGLAREFKGGIKAVDGIELRVSPGEIYGFLGPNGAGKSTTVHMLTTLLPPTAGWARVAGLDVVKQGPKVRSVIGAALQEAALDPFLTGREHLRLQSSLHGLSRDERRRRSDELLERVGLTLAADRKVKGTQYLEEADTLADRVGIIHHGHIVAEGTPDELKAQIGRPTVEAVPADPNQREAIQELLRQFGTPTPGSPDAVSVRCEQEADLADIIRALDAAELHVAQIQLHEPSLDDVFLAKTGTSLEGAAEEEELETVTA